MAFGQVIHEKRVPPIGDTLHVSAASALESVLTVALSSAATDTYYHGTRRLCGCKIKLSLTKGTL
ncbi:MAG: hypothetical protein IJL91_12035, partial [Bacteroidales bacterium]|nr:hypothetical protein [Bacteroidales bacterium]